MPDPAAFYHVHTFVAEPDDPSIVLGTGEYGVPFVSFVESGNVFGAQCHPEKSSKHGLALLRNFVGICASVRVDSRSRVILYPAIDIAGGRAVRLVQGDFDAETVYADSPLEAARAWVDAGATHLHVDRPRRRAHRRAAEPAPPAPDRRRARRAGAIWRRSALGAAVADAIGAGAGRAILGTAAFSDALPRAGRRALRGRIVVSVDTRGGFVSTAGWTETTSLPAADVIEGMQERGVRSFVFTNVDKDGLLGGPDLEEVRQLASVVTGQLIYSGGIGRREDLEGLAALAQATLALA